jgi:predicted TIM-barrel fold metal-dependent hydrolase
VTGPITDCHVHIQPHGMLQPKVREAFFRGCKDADEAKACLEDPQALLAYMDRAGVERFVLINYESPEVMGFTAETNDWVLAYCQAAPDRLLPCVGPHPKFHEDLGAEAIRLIEGGARMFKIHGPHMLVQPNAYLGEYPQLADLYRVLSDAGVPVMFHTGTSIFSGARIKYGDPVRLDDVGCDFPDLKVIIAHGGRPLWTDEAWFLVRRFRNFHLDLSGIPPRRILEWFPRLDQIAGRTMFGTDWPSPGIPPVKENLDAIRALGLGPEALEQILSATALRLFPPG